MTNVAEPSWKMLALAWGITGAVLALAVVAAVGLRWWLA